MRWRVCEGAHGAMSACPSVCTHDSDCHGRDSRRGRVCEGAQGFMSACPSLCPHDSDFRSHISRRGRVCEGAHMVISLELFAHRSSGNEAPKTHHKLVYFILGFQDNFHACNCNIEFLFAS